MHILVTRILKIFATGAGATDNKFLQNLVTRILILTSGAILSDKVKGEKSGGVPNTFQFTPQNLKCSRAKYSTNTGS